MLLWKKGLVKKGLLINEESFLQDIDALIKKSLDNIQEKASLLHEASTYLSLAENAKRVRASLTYLFGSYLKIDSHMLLSIATSAELVHAASLMHDDVIDNSNIRRSQETSNILYGNTISVLAGDLLYSMALELLSPLPPKVLIDAIEVVKRMTISVSQEYIVRGNLKVTLEEWLEISHGKTAVLFAWCIKSVAACIHDVQLYKKLEEVGVNLGIAFQIADDLKDFFSDVSFGKSKYIDIYNKNPNYVLILAITEDPSLIQLVEKFWEDPNEKILKKIIIKIEESGAQALALQDFIKYFKKSLESVDTAYITGFKKILKTMFHSIKINSKTKLSLKKEFQELEKLF